MTAAISATSSVPPAFTAGEIQAENKAQAESSSLHLLELRELLRLSVIDIEKAQNSKTLLDLIEKTREAARKNLKAFDPKKVTTNRDELLAISITEQFTKILLNRFKIGLAGELSWKGTPVNCWNEREDVSQAKPLTFKNLLSITCYVYSLFTKNSKELHSSGITIPKEYNSLKVYAKIHRSKLYLFIGMDKGSLDVGGNAEIHRQVVVSCDKEEPLYAVFKCALDGKNCRDKIQNEIYMIDYINSASRNREGLLQGTYLTTFNSPCGYMMPYYANGDLFNAHEANKLTQQEKLSVWVYLRNLQIKLRQIGILHKDIRLENILITDEGRLILCDFGESDIVSELTRDKIRANWTNSSMINIDLIKSIQRAVSGHNLTNFIKFGYALEAFNLAVCRFMMIANHPPFFYIQKRVMEQELNFLNTASKPFLEDFPYELYSAHLADLTIKPVTSQLSYEEFEKDSADILPEKEILPLKDNSKELS